MGPLNLVLHVLHIVAGVVWAGGAILMGFFIGPAVTATRPESGRFMQQLTGPAKLPVFMTIAAWITAICGIAMFAPATGSLDAGIMRTPHGITLSIGALFAIAALLEGQFLIAPTAFKIGAIGRAIAASGTGPTPEQGQQLQVLQARMASATKRGAILLIVAVVCMAAARWL